MRIVSLGVNLLPSSGGTHRAVSDFHDAFQASGIEHRILNFCNVEATARMDGMSIIPTSRAWIAGSYFWLQSGTRQTMADLLATSELLFIHGLFIQPLLNATQWARASRIPYIVVPHGSLDPFVFTYRAFRKRAWMRLYGREMLGEAASVLFSTHREREKALYSSMMRKAIIPWPVPEVAERDKEMSAQLLRAKLNLPEHQRLALYCGRLHPIKRPLETIEAFLTAAPLDWTLLVVGGSSKELSVERVRQFAEPAGHRLRVVGPVYGESLQDYYSAAELLLLLSRKENFGYVVAEALAFGTPVVVSEEVDLSPHILEARCGFVLPSWSDRYRSLASIFRTSSDALREYGLRGREWTRRDLSKVRFRHDLVELIRSAVKSEPEAITECTS